MNNTASQIISSFLYVSTTDPEDARRQRLLNILIAGVLVICTLAGLAILLTSGILQPWEFIFLLVADIVMFSGTLLIYFINRYGSGWVASFAFTLLITILFAASDAPKEVVEGRSLFFLAIPILMGSVLLRPYASFIMAIISSGVVFVIALTNDLQPNFIAFFGFMTIALVSWLSARSLERALHDLQQINRELDQRVADRTRDLQSSLQREQAESGKNQAILESIADGVVFFDTDNTILVANHSLISLLGESESHVEGKTLEQLMGSNVLEEGQKQLLDYRDSFDRQTPSIPIAWGEKTLSISFAPVMTATNDKIGSVMVCRDFTREAELERLKDRFLSMTSHELRTPLNAIIGYTDMIEAKVFGELSEKQDETVHRITANAKRMLGLVNDILDQAHIEAGTINVNPSEFEIQRVIDDVYSVTGVLATHKRLSLDIQIEDEVPTTMVNDEQRLMQILLNLVGNAIKFTKEGGVTLRVYRSTNQYLNFDIQDTGIGIPTGAQDSIFDAFWQVDDPRTREIGGSGLGLSIVKQLVNLLNGTITIKSKVDEGTTFTVSVPLAIEVEQQVEESTT